MTGSIRWNPPSYDWFKVNTNGAFYEVFGLDACGAVIIDNQSRRRGGVVRNAGRCNMLDAEMWSLNLAWDLGSRHVVIESDFLRLVNLINKGRQLNKFNLVKLDKNNNNFYLKRFVLLLKINSKK